MGFKGMTVNERLYVSGLMDKFDKAIENNDIESLKVIIEKVALDESYIETVIEDFNLKKRECKSNN